jgi:hypothetical protein
LFLNIKGCQKCQDLFGISEIFLYCVLFVFSRPSTSSSQFIHSPAKGFLKETQRHSPHTTRDKKAIEIYCLYFLAVSPAAPKLEGNLGKRQKDIFQGGKNIEKKYIIWLQVV